MTKSQLSKQVLKQVEWEDLRQLTAWQVAYNVILPYPFLVLSWWSAFQSHFVLAMIFSYAFYASAFRQVHDGFHGSLGVKKPIITGLLTLMSALLLASTHAIKATHLSHHRHPLADNDVEGQLARLTWWQAILGGVRFRLQIHEEGKCLSNAKNRWHIRIDLVMVGLFIGLTVATQWQFLWFHVVTMIVGNTVVGFVGVWGLHHGCDGANDVIARTERNWLANKLTFNLLYHAEHHLFPAVPSNHLPILAKRLDEQLLHLTSKKVLPFLQAQSNNTQCPIRKRLA